MSYQDVTVKLIGGPEKLQGRMERVQHGRRDLLFPHIPRLPQIDLLDEGATYPSLDSIPISYARYEIDYKDPRYDGKLGGDGRHYPAYFVDEEKRDLKRKFDGLEELLRVERVRRTSVEAELERQAARDSEQLRQVDDELIKVRGTVSIAVKVLTGQPIP